MAEATRTPRRRRRPAGAAAASSLPEGRVAAVRMYRAGLGDITLVRLRREGRPFSALIGCRVDVAGDDRPRAKAIAADVAALCEGTLDLVCVMEARPLAPGDEAFIDALGAAKVTARQVCLPWTLDPDEPVAAALAQERRRVRRALHRLRTSVGASLDVRLFDTLLAREDGAEASAAERLREALGGPDLTFCRPTDPPLALEGTGASLYALGPAGPHDGTARALGADMAVAESVLGWLEAPTRRQPFDARFTIPAPHVKSLIDRLETDDPPTGPAATTATFFRDHYYGNSEHEMAWRRVDHAAGALAMELALSLDADANSAGLAIAVAVEEGPVLLFPGATQSREADAFATLAWQDGPERVTGADLLSRAVMVQLGHHGSRSGIPMGALLSMGSLASVLVPVDQRLAAERGLSALPAPEVLAAAARATAAQGGVLLRSDRDGPVHAAVHSTEHAVELLL